MKPIRNENTNTTYVRQDCNDLPGAAYEYEDGTKCIILNLDYIVPIDKLKIRSVLTKEQFENISYKVGEK